MGQIDFSVTRKGTEYYLKKTEQIRPDYESHIFSGSYKAARNLWSRLIRTNKKEKDE